MDVLIVEDENSLRESIRDGLQAALGGLEVIGCASVEEAERAIEDLSWPQVIVSDIRLPGKSGTELLLEVRARRPKLKVILMSAYVSPSALSHLAEGSVLRFLRKPFELNELVAEVRDALEQQEMSGSVSGITFIDILQVLHMGKRSAVLRLRQGDRVGHIHVVDGEVVHADCGEIEGEEAFDAMMSWPSASFKVQDESPVERRTLDIPFNYLVLEAARRFDEATRQENDATTDNQTHGDEIPSEETLLANLNDLCKDIVDDTPDAVAANIVDLSTGMMLAGHFLSNFTTDHFEAVSAAVTNLFRGKETLRVENLVKAQRGVDSDEHYMEQVHFSTTHLEHFVLKLPGKEAVLTLVVRKPGNIGMGWAAVRSAAPKMAEQVPS